MEDVRKIIRTFIVDAFQAGSAEVQIDENTSFLETGLVDSMRVLELVDFLEERFGIRVENSELVPQNLDSIRNIAEYLLVKGVTNAGS